MSTLVKAENADRKNLYTTIARESGIADAKIKDIGRLFSQSWQKQLEDRLVDRDQEGEVGEEAEAEGAREVEDVVSSTEKPASSA